VKGSINVMVAVGPTPGKTPIIVPIKTPKKQPRRYSSEKKVLNPLNRRSHCIIFSLKASQKILK
jgi:hypothetical protein